MRTLIFLLAFSCVGLISALSQDRDYGRSMVITDLGIVATSHVLASQAGGLFALDPKHPNSLAPHKRPFHTIIPAFMERGDDHIGFGIMGGSNQPLAHAQFVSNIVDYGWNIQAALSAPRFTIRDTGEPIKCTILLEARLSREVQAQLRQKGHVLVLRKDYSAFMGRGQAVLHNSKTGTNFAASDPRADDSAEPEPIAAQ